MISIKPPGYYGRKVPAEKLARYLRQGLPSAPEGPGSISGWGVEPGPQGPDVIINWNVKLNEH